MYREKDEWLKDETHIPLLRYVAAMIMMYNGNRYLAVVGSSDSMVALSGTYPAATYYSKEFYLNIPQVPE